MKVKIPSREDGFRTVEAKKVGRYLCVHPRAGWFGMFSYRNWAVSHRPTGWAVHQYFSSESNAVAFAREADKLSGWDKIVRKSENDPFDISFPKRLRERLGKKVKNLIEKFEAVE